MERHWVVVTVIVMLLLAGICAPAMAAAPTQASTPTPTDPPSSVITTLPSGNSLLIERRWTYGDLFVGLSVLFVAVVVAAAELPDLLKRIFGK